MLLFTDDNTHISLSEANSLVRGAVEMALPEALWVQAEVLDIREKGHCYMELVEKDDVRNTPIAQARACCWSNTWQAVKRKCEQAFAPPHSHQSREGVAGGVSAWRGLKMLFLLKANFHEAYGFSWIVEDIDPTYTIGEMARRRAEILRKLKEAGIIDMQKELPISPFATRIAVISSASAAGYGDFCNQLAENDYGFAFRTTLFPAIMQGEQTSSSIISALDAINADGEKYDVVVIIRGGGSTADLSGFDTFELAENIANFPLPIITGIGHERDETVIDTIARVSVKTPTAVAAFLIDNLAATLEMLGNAALRIQRAVQHRLETEKMKLEGMDRRIANSVSLYFIKQRHLLQMMEQRIKAVDPMNILRRGYSIVLHKGKPVTDADALNKGDNLTLIAAKGQKVVEVK
jgi:exodeoxyribonuclease VII large subunit